MKKLVAIAILLASVKSSIGQVENTSYVTRTGEKVLQLAITVPVDKKAAWQLFTTDEQLVKWIAPLAHIELKTGGFIVTNYNRNKSLDDSTSIRLGLINYLENELLTLKVNLNNNFSKKVQEEDNNLQEVIRFVEAGPGKTRIISSMIGWGVSEDWNKTYQFFERGNEWTFKEMLKLFNKN
jgi:hypothetical protein